MASPQLAQVIAHLRSIGTRSATSGGDIAATRKLVDAYGDVDPSVRAFEAEVRRTDAPGRDGKRGVGVPRQHDPEPSSESTAGSCGHAHL